MVHKNIRSFIFFVVEVFDMEKRLHDLDTKCQFVAREAEKMKTELETTKQQTQELFRILEANNILDSGDSIISHDYINSIILILL